MSPLFKKLNFGIHETIMVLNAPDSFNDELEQLNGVEVVRKARANLDITFAIGFATKQTELDKISTSLAKAIQGDGVIWIAYPKGTSKKYRCEFNRDSGWKVIGDAGFEPVRQIAIDDDWTALRFRRTEFIQSLTRRNSMAISKEGQRRTNRSAKG